ncbi:MAG: sulfatase-like hydrolase/transferase, partial [Armatimonadetes bacterium]|nr:sulfatase-like hydrolase/transferase [Armatimonadota bacterium]
FNPGPQGQDNPDFGLPPTETVLPERLKSIGYATGMVGKWHLGFKPEMQPVKRGFDEFFGFLGGAHSYLPSPSDQRGSILRGTEPVAETEYLTEALAREAVSFIARHQREPFFLYLPFNAVHAPMQATEKYLARFDGIADTKRRTFAAMLSALDDAVGAVLQKLRELKLEENTLIFFISDNGGPTPQTTSRNNPLRGTKAKVLEGGIRVPFMVQWKGRLPAGKTYSKPVISLDIHPTAFAAAGGNLPGEAKLDGIDLLPYLTGKNTKTPHDRLYWRFGDQCAIRKGDWKLVRLRGESAQLYNLKEDVGEKNDLASPNPEKLKELQADYDEWNADLMDPRWGRAGARKRGRRQRLAPKGRRNPLRKPD